MIQTGCSLLISLLSTSLCNCQSEVDFFGLDFPNTPSKTNPVNTKIAPSHCLSIKWFPKNITDARTVKNLRVVVINEHGKGPNSETHMKMKYCPKALATDTLASCHTIVGCLPTNAMKSHSSPDHIKPMPR